MDPKVHALLESRAFQLEDYPWFMANPRSMNLYEPRLGKTVITVSCILTDPNCSKILVLCSKNAVNVWRRHFIELHALLGCNRSLELRLVRGDASTRQMLWAQPCTKQMTVFLTTFGSMDRDTKYLQLPSMVKKLLLDTVIGDEVHLRWRNRKNKAVAYAKWLTRPEVCKRFHALSGTLTSKGGPTDFWAILNMIDPKRFSSFWQFANIWCEIIDNGFGKEIIGPRNLPAFHKMLQTYARIRIRKICAPQMPVVARSLIRVQMTAPQRRLYEAIKEDMFIMTEEGSFVVVSNSLESNTRFRQICTCPAILGTEFGVGAAVEDMIERLTDEDAGESDRHVVIFLQFKKAAEHVMGALSAAGFKDIFFLFGGMEAEDQEEQIRRFQETKGIILCTVQYAQAFSLVPSLVAYFIGYSYDPGDNKQAEDRLVPQEGMDSIMAYYYCCVDSPDEKLAETVNMKNRRISITIGSAQHRVGITKEG